ncbi:MAG: ArnT family glycosyltransferase [Vicinamibacterales bacterium]
MARPPSPPVPDTAALPRAALWVAAGAVFVVVSLVAWSGLKAVSEARPSVPIGPRPQPLTLTRGLAVDQTFRVPQEPFDSISLCLEGPVSATARLSATVTRLVGIDNRDGEVAVSQELDVRPADGREIVLRFPPVPASRRQTFRLSVVLLDAAGDPPTLLVNARSNYRQGRLFVDGRERWGDLVFSAGSHGATVTTTVRGFLTGVPAPFDSPFLFAMAIVAFAALGAGAVALAASGGRSGPLLLPLGMYLTGALLWLLVTPPLEAPDEPSHYDMARYIAAEGRLPDHLQDDRTVWYDGEWFQPPLYYALLSPVVSLAGGEDARPPRDHNDRARALGGSDPLVFRHADPPDVSFRRTLFSLRLVNVALGALTVALLYRLVMATAGDRRTAAMATAGLVLVPQVTTLAAVMNNDGLATTLAALATVLLLETQCPATCRRLFAAGLVTGAAVLAKLNAAYLVPMAGVSIVASNWRSLSVLVRAGLAFTAGVALTGSWHFVRNWYVFGDPLARDFTVALAAPAQVPQSRGLLDPFFLTVLPNDLYRSFWASAGWMSVQPPGDAWVWRLYAIVTALLFGALAAYAVRVISGRTAGGERTLALVAASGIAFDLAAFLWYAGIWSANQSRYFYPALGPAFVLVVPAISGVIGTLRSLHPAAGRLAVAALFAALAAAWVDVYFNAVLEFYIGRF